MYLSYHTDVAFSASSGNKKYYPGKRYQMECLWNDYSERPQYRNRSVILYTPLHLIPNDNLKELMIVWPC